MKNGARVSLAKNLKRMRKELSRLAPRVQKKWDPDQLHDLRVLTRRLRAIVWLSRHSANGYRLKVLRLALRDLGHALGEKRTLDVLQKDAKKYQVDGKLRSDNLKKVKKQIETRLGPDQRKELDHLLFIAEKKIGKLKPRDLEPALAELIVRLEKLGERNPKNPKQWHLLRIEVKKVRYAAELLGVKVGELKELQDLLGKGHDLGLLMERTGRNQKITSDLKKVWKKSEKITVPNLKKSEQKLLACRKFGSSHNIET